MKLEKIILLLDRENNDDLLADRIKKFKTLSSLDVAFNRGFD